MKHYRLLWLSCMAALLPSTMQAQDESFDLSSQRGEKQEVNMIPGKKIDHKGLVINPTPHEINIDEAQGLDIAQGVVVKDKQGKFANDLKFLNVATKASVKMDIVFGSKQAAKAGVKAVSGAYKLTVDKKGIHVVGYDERGAFYALQTLRDITCSERFKGKPLPYLTVNDWPDLPLRGVVEGFYGNPWSHEVRLSLIDFYGKHKMNVFVDGPKDDPYHSSPHWRKPYPDKEAQNIRELVTACQKNRVDFVWAIHPGKDIKWNEEDYGNLVHKFNLMYDLGVRSFAIHFDDIDGEGTNPVKQVELLNRLTKEFVKAKGDVAPLVVCPTDYSQLWANPKPTGSLAIYGNTLDPDINVFWTGAVVCSDLTKETLDWVNSRIKRPAYYWWNFPVTDYARHIIMQGPSYGLETTLTDKDTRGVLSNPMEHGEASKLALYGVADYNWNIAAYNPIDNWERGLVELTPEAADAYRTFAIHSCDTETGYRRIESWETTPFRISKYTPAQYEALKKEFAKVEKAPEIMERQCRNQLLLNELRPWLKEFGKLGKRGSKAMELIKLYEQGNLSAFWKGYVNNTMTAEDLAAYNAHKSGTMVLQPFYENTMDDMATGFYEKLTGEKPDFYKGIGTYATLRTTQSKLMLDGNADSYYHSGNGQATGHFVGLDLGKVKPVSEVVILQGRNSVDDVDYYDNTILEYSLDGKSWKALTGELANTYEVRWKGEPVQARYVRIRKLESKKGNWIAVREFTVNPTTPENVGFPVEAANVTAAMTAFDHNPCTPYTMQGTLTFGIPEGTKQYTLLLKRKGAVSVKQFDAKGNCLSTATADSDFFVFQPEAKAVKVSVEGSADIYEVVRQ